MEDAERLFKRACAVFQELAVPFQLGRMQLEYAEWLAAQGRAEEAQPVLVEARAIFERLGAKPWLERLGQTSRVEVDSGPVTVGS